MKPPILLTLLASFLLFSSLAVAAPIVGNIAFGGRMTLDTNNINTATTVTNWANTHVEITDGDFASILSGTPATFAGLWVFNPSTPTPGFWSVGGFTFDLLTATIISQGGGFLNITGTGIVSSTNPAFDPTLGTWSFSAQDPKVAGSFSFSAADAVPEPSTTMAILVGTGVFGLGAIRRVWRRSQRS